MPKHYGSKQFRKNLGSIIKDSVTQQENVLIYNEKFPTQSFFVIPYFNHIDSLQLIDSQKANEFIKLFENLQTARSNKFREMVLKRYEKSI